MRHAMLMCIHKNFDILQMFVDLFDDERFDFYILLDKKVPINEKNIIKRYPQYSKVFFCPRLEISWAGYSQIDATLRLYEMSSKIGYDYYHFLQGSDFPVKTKDEVDYFFTKIKKGTEFINIYTSDFAKTKCGYYHFFTDNRWYRKNILVKSANKGFLILQKLFHIKRNHDITLYSGSALASLTHECVTFVLSKEEEIRQRFRFSLAADEVFLQTIIGNSTYKDHIYKFGRNPNSNVRLIDWNRRDDNSPYTFKLEDFDILISTDKDICFARKFDESIDMEIVRKLYNYLKSKEIS